MEALTLRTPEARSIEWPRDEHAMKQQFRLDGAPLTRAEMVCSGLLRSSGKAGPPGEVLLTDNDPLVVVMEITKSMIERLPLSVRGPSGSQVWLEVIEWAQSDPPPLEHNRFIPCRSCDRAFRPAIDRSLLKLFLAWSDSLGAYNRSAERLIELHRCRRCGGQLNELETKYYAGDYHTPEPGFSGTDEQWAEALLLESGFCFVRPWE